MYVCVSVSVCRSACLNFEVFIQAFYTPLKIYTDCQDICRSLFGGKGKKNTLNDVEPKAGTFLMSLFCPAYNIHVLLISLKAAIEERS